MARTVSQFLMEFDSNAHLDYSSLDTEEQDVIQEMVAMGLLDYKFISFNWGTKLKFYLTRDGKHRVTQDQLAETEELDLTEEFPPALNSDFLEESAGLNKLYSEVPTLEVSDFYPVTMDITSHGDRARRFT